MTINNFLKSFGAFLDFRILSFEKEDSNSNNKNGRMKSIVSIGNCYNDIFFSFYNKLLNNCVYTTGEKEIFRLKKKKRKIISFFSVTTNQKK